MTTATDGALIQLSKAQQALERAKSLSEVKEFIDQGEAVRVYAKRVGASTETVNAAVEFKLDAMRKAGEMLATMEREQHGGDRKSKSRAAILKLADLGISPSNSSRWQRATEVPEEDYRRWVAQANEKKMEISLSGLLRLQKQANQEKRRKENAELVKKFTLPEDLTEQFQTIVLDPPWDFKEEGDHDVFGRTRPTYHQLSKEEIEKLPVSKWAKKDCHLYLWITNRSLMTGKGWKLCETWGFRPVTLLTWCKPSIGVGNYYRNNTEHVIFAVKGSLQLLRSDVGTWFEAKRGSGGHSSKPDEFYSLIETCSPGPYLDWPSRNERQGWICIGAEV